MSLNLKLRENGEVSPRMGKPLGESLFRFASWTRPRLSVNDAKQRVLVLSTASSLYRPHPWPPAFRTPNLEYIYPFGPPPPPAPSCRTRGFPHPATAGGPFLQPSSLQRSHRRLTPSSTVTLLGLSLLCQSATHPRVPPSPSTRDTPQS